MITFALSFIPVYSNLSIVARGTQRAGGARPGGRRRGRGVSKSGRDEDRQREIRKKQRQIDRQTEGQRL